MKSSQLPFAMLSLVYRCPASTMLAAVVIHSRNENMNEKIKMIINEDTLIELLFVT